MAYLIFSTQEEVETYQVQVDADLGYPEDPDSLTYVGEGIHCPKELGLALHYAEIIKHPTEDQWALPQEDENSYPCPGPVPVIGKGGKIEPRIMPMAMIQPPQTATIVEELPEGWLPEMLESIGP